MNEGWQVTRIAAADGPVEQFDLLLVEGQDESTDCQTALLRLSGKCEMKQALRDRSGRLVGRKHLVLPQGAVENAALPSKRKTLRGRRANECKGAPRAGSIRPVLILLPHCTFDLVPASSPEQG